MFVSRSLSVVRLGFGFADDGGERFGRGGVWLFVVGDVEPCVEGLVGESAVAVVGVRVSMVRVGEEPQRVVEERPAAGVQLVVCGKKLLDVRELPA